MKYIKSYEKKFQLYYYIIPTDNIKEQLKKINCPDYFIQKILRKKIIKNIQLNKYTYISWNDYEDDWDYMPLEYYKNNKLLDGEFAYLEARTINYIFAGYNNLTEHQKQEVFQIKEKIKILKDAEKYNL